MERILAMLALSVMIIPTQAQIVLNGGFEEWDSTHYTVDWPEVRPLYWWMWQYNTFCVPQNLHAKPSLSHHSGCCSVVMEAAYCGSSLELGFIYSGELGQSTPYYWSQLCEDRPTLLNFYYKFHPEGGDSAYVSILLFNYDSITPGLPYNERTDTVAFSSGYMDQEVTEFTPYSLPVEYLSADTPAFMQISFRTSENSYQYAHPGTTLWVDDVTVNKGTIGVAEHTRPEASIVYPNPGHDQIRFRMPKGSILLRASVFDARGLLVLEAQPPTGSGLDVRGLANGPYTIELTTTAGERLHVKWIKE